ncbi:MAG: efflux RND transporter periplasmic adaptor subunit [Gemmatimonadaceae bacterium]
MIAATPLALLIVAALLAACSRDSDEKTPLADSATGATSMASMPGMDDMPGMTMPPDTTSTSTVSFSAAQIANGRVKWALPDQASVAGVVEVPGQLIANEDRTARLAAPAQARVLRVHVSPGDRVAAGARLVTLQSQEASMAHADVGKATAELASRRAAATYAKSARDRGERLLALKAIPRQDYERAIADDELARAGVTQAEAELQRARSNAMQLGVDLQDGSMTLRSPIGGVVTTRDAVPGAVVSAGAQLVTITDPAALWLAVALPEAFASGVRVGSALRFTVAPYPSDTFTARVQSVSATFDPTTRSLPVRGVIANPGGRLRPEMYARVWVPSASRSTLLTVPDAAIQRLNGKTVVFVAHPDGKGGARFEPREVQVVGAAGGRISILGGLSPGEPVVVAGAYAVKAQLAKTKMPKMEM